MLLPCSPYEALLQATTWRGLYHPEESPREKLRLGDEGRVGGLVDGIPLALRCYALL